MKICIRGSIIFLIFLSGLVTHCSKEIQTTATEQFKITIVSGDNQTGQRNELLRKPIVVEITNRTGTLVGGAIVAFEVIEGGGVLNTGPLTRMTAQSNGEGKVEIDWTLGSGTSQRIKIWVNQQDYSAMPVYISAVLYERWASLSVYSGDSQTGMKGEQLPEPVVVKVTDAEKNPIEGVTVLFDVADGGGEINRSKTRTNDDGLAEVLWTIGKGQNEMQVSIRDTFYLAHPITVTAKYEYVYRIPEKLTDGWEVMSFKEAGLDSAKIYTLGKRIISKEFESIFGLLIVKDGKLLFEEYPNSDRNSMPNLFSVTKSFTSALIGIAIDEGFIPGVNVPVFDYFPEYDNLKNEDKEKILLKHALSMTGGFDWEEWLIPYTNSNNSWVQMYTAANRIRFLLDLPVVDEPGTKFEYSTGLSTLLGEIIRKSTSFRADEFAEEHLFEPLGIENYYWWAFSDSLLSTGSDLHLKLRDAAKFGYLYLQGGYWNGEQVIPEEWVNESLRLHIQRGTSSAGFYGYQWWIHQSDTQYYYYALGYGGQYILNIPEKNMVIVMANTPGVRDQSTLLSLIFNAIK